MTAYLQLSDGTVFEGTSVGFPGDTQGEVVFSTGMTGYPESMSDPSFAGQILVFTYPLIGNYGVPKLHKMEPALALNFESLKVWTKGIIVADLSLEASHGESASTLQGWLVRNKIPAISGIDTRLLTQYLRDHHVMQGRILHRKPAQWGKEKKSSQTFWVQETSTSKILTYTPTTANQKTVALIDCGVKHGILRALLGKGFTVIRVPWNVNPLSLGKKLDGVVGSNGPGDPKECKETVTHVKEVLAKGIPYLGICLGHQILALAIGADTYKLPFGHRGLNQPCQETETKKAYLTSQNHGYAVDTKTIPRAYEEWFINLNDQTNEGLKSTTKPVHSVQFHPEGHPGPFDTDWIFDVL